MAVAQDDRMRVRAQAKWVRTSARKARLVLDHIRGRSVPEARTILAFTQRAAATDIEKVLRSAVAGVAPEGPGGGELAELVPDHLLGHEDGHVLASVVDRDGVPDHLREDRRGA